MREDCQNIVLDSELGASPHVGLSRAIADAQPDQQEQGFPGHKQIIMTPIQALQHGKH